MTIGEKIKMKRKESGLTQTELGAKLGVQKNAVSKWECGRVDDIPCSKIKAMAKLFGVQPSYLIDDETNDISYVHQINTSVSAYEKVSAEAKEIAKAFDKATPKEQNLVRLTLSEYLDDEGYQIAAARGNSAVKIPIQRGMDDFPENDSIVDDL